VAFVGAGGKTMAIFQLARELPVPCLITCTTHLGAWQLDQANVHILAKTPADLKDLGEAEISVVTGPAEADERLGPVTPAVLKTLRRESLAQGWTLLVEADGARQKPLKAPRADEPRLPLFAEIVVVVAGLGGLGRQLNGENVHRPEIYAGLAGLEPGMPVTGRALGKVLAHPQGGLKDIPQRARRIALLNQADTPELQAEARRIATEIKDAYDAVVIAALRDNTVHAVQEPCAGIVLAAGGATRFGSPKQLLPWREEPMVRASTRSALSAGLSPVIVVVGAAGQAVENAVSDLPVSVARNPSWETGQSSSIRAGLAACPPSVCSAVFLLADQPHITPDVIQALVDAHASERAAIVAPLIQGDRRGNPVLFDRETFADLNELRGDDGGRAIFTMHRVHYVPWHDERIARDVDTEEDYRRLRQEDQP
jgi:molybdenum cofactor cytidylyltransferase